MIAPWLTNSKLNIMTQIKFFTFKSLSNNNIEGDVNKFLQEHAEDEIVSIQDQANFDPHGCTVMITYRTK